MQDIRITINVAKLLREFLDDPAEPRYGYDLMKSLGFKSGLLYPMLARLEFAGWLETEREVIDPSEAGRPARTMYRLTREGAVRARQELAQMQAALSRQRRGSRFRAAQGEA